MARLLTIAITCRSQVLHRHPWPTPCGTLCEPRADERIQGRHCTGRGFTGAHYCCGAQQHFALQNESSRPTDGVTAVLNSNGDDPRPMNFVGEFKQPMSVREFGCLVGLPEDDALWLQSQGVIPVEGTARQWLRAYCEYLRLRCVHPPEASLKKGIDRIEVSSVYVRDQLKCADICIRGRVSFGDQPNDFLDQIAALDVDELCVRINSPGGEYHTGVSIYRALKQHRAFVTVIVEGEAASAASIIAMAGDRVALVPGARLMIHGCSFFGIGGNHNTFHDCAEALRRFDAETHVIYAAKSGRSTEFFRMMLSGDRNHWLTAEEAIALGLADAMCAPPDPASGVQG